MKHLHRTLAAMGLAATASLAQAAVTLYTDEAAYAAAVGATRTYIDFAGSPGAIVSGASFSPDVAFGSCGSAMDPGSCGSTVLHSSNAITDIGGAPVPNGVGSLAWRFNLADVYAFGFHYVSGAIAAVNLVDEALSITSIDTSAARGFIGLVSDAAFFGGIGVNGVFPEIGNDRYFIDDFRINGIAQVPEPASLALVGLGLAVAGSWRRKSPAKAA